MISVGSYHVKESQRLREYFHIWQLDIHFGPQRGQTQESYFETNRLYVVKG